MKYLINILLQGTSCGGNYKVEGFLIRAQDKVWDCVQKKHDWDPSCNDCQIEVSHIRGVQTQTQF